MEYSRINALLTLCMLKIRYQDRNRLSLKNIQAKAKGLANVVLDEQSIIDSIQRLRNKAHVRGQDDNLLLGSGIVHHYIEILQYDNGVSVDETLDILENCIRHYTGHLRYLS